MQIDRAREAVTEPSGRRFCPNQFLEPKDFGKARAEPPGSRLVRRPPTGVQHRRSRGHVRSAFVVRRAPWQLARGRASRRDSRGGRCRQRRNHATHAARTDAADGMRLDTSKWHPAAATVRAAIESKSAGLVPPARRTCARDRPEPSSGCPGSLLIDHLFNPGVGHWPTL
jgi:hypothetical protein